MIANFDINEKAVKGYGSKKSGKFFCCENPDLSVAYLSSLQKSITNLTTRGR